MSTSPPTLSPPELVWHGRVPFALASLPADYAATLTAFALRHEEKVRKLAVTNGWEKLAETNPTTARYGSYNAFMLDPVCLPLFFAVRTLYRYLLGSTGRPRPASYIQCWYNVHRAGQALHRHCHSASYIGVFSACAEGSETKFGPFPVSTEHDRAFPHRDGQLLITEGGIKNYHEVSVWQRTDVPRVTFAFDILEARAWDKNLVLIPFDSDVPELPPEDAASSR